jgi:hypothetical protein
MPAVFPVRRRMSTPSAASVQLCLLVAAIQDIRIWMRQHRIQIDTHGGGGRSRLARSIILNAKDFFASLPGFHRFPLLWCWNRIASGTSYDCTRKIRPHGSCDLPCNHINMFSIHMGNWSSIEPQIVLPSEQSSLLLHGMLISPLFL